MKSSVLHICLLFGIIANSRYCCLLESEIYLRNQESSYMQTLLHKLKVLGVNMRAFYHISGWQENWKDVVKQQLEIVDGRNITTYINRTVSTSLPKTIHSILHIVDQMQITIAGIGDHAATHFKDISSFIQNQNLANHHKIHIKFAHTLERGTFEKSNSSFQDYLLRSPSFKNVTEGEVSSLRSLHDYCLNETRHKQQAFVLYFHSKSGCCPPSHVLNSRVQWRNKMNLYMLEYPSICLRALLYGYAVCGTDLYIRNWAHAHFAGNFWWANCGHIAALSPIDHNFKWQECEFFVFNVSKFGNVKDDFAQRCSFHVSPFGRTKAGSTDDFYSRGDYLAHIQATYFTPGSGRQEPSTGVETEQLTNHPPGKTKPQRWVQEICPKTWSSPYRQQQGWDVGNSWWR